MNAVVLFAGRLSATVYEPLSGGRDSLTLAVERARSFPGVAEVILLARSDFEAPPGLGTVRTECSDHWGMRSVLDSLAEISKGVDLLYFAWADCPLLDPVLAASMQDRHLRFAAEYTFADGWPYGLAPEILSPTTAATLAYLAGDDNSRVERDLLFTVIQKDINSFDLETEISPVDLRMHRLTLAADSKRNVLLLRRLMDAGLAGAADAERVLKERPELLRTLPAFYSVQVEGGCPQACTLCPYPAYAASSPVGISPAGISTAARTIPAKASASNTAGTLLAPTGTTVLARRDEMPVERFSALLDSISAFSGDAVVDISLWGECSLHSRITELIAAALARPEISLVVETCGLGWKKDDLQTLAGLVRDAPPRLNGMAPLTWIVALDAEDPALYEKLRGTGYAEVRDFAESLLALFPKDTHVQALRIIDGEEDLERFYRAWKLKTPNVIVQKHDDFCAFLKPLKATDLSPVRRFPCRHLMRDLSVLVDGTVPFCKEDLGRNAVIGNVFKDGLPTIWERLTALYANHAAGNYPGLCAECDEYYTYNF
jgi:spore coat polysaccharide biosynthesis protein SpsF (cytidylyltransferase family)